jgi:hypothetical protein
LVQQENKDHKAFRAQQVLKVVWDPKVRQEKPGQAEA